MTSSTTSTRARTAGLAVLLATSALAAPAFAATDATQATGATSVEELVVTAGKRSESIKNTPTAITAITSDKLDTLGIRDFNDYMQYVPSLQMADEGGPGQGIMIIRGVYSGFEQTTPTVGFYIDETPFTPSSASSVGTLVMPDPGLDGIDRVEVLKGPQATLYGASTLGGLIRIVTSKPDFSQFSGELRADGAFVDGGGDGYGVSGSVNIPLGADLAARITGFDRLDPGFVDNVQTGKNNTNTTRVDGGRITIRYAPTDRLDIELNGFAQNLHNNDVDGEDLDPTTLQPLEGRYKYTNFFPTNIDTKYYIGNLTGNYRFDAGTLTEAASYGHYNSDEFFDYSKIYGPLLGFAPPEATFGQLIPTMNKFTEELRFTSSRIGPFELQGGLFYTHERITYDAILTGLDGTTGAPLPAPLFNLINALTLATYDEYAIYGDATYHLGPRLDVTAGIRESHNVQHADAISTAGLFGPASNNPSQSSNSDTSYLFTLRWRPTDELSTYVRAASAYRPGGPQFSPSPTVPPSFGPDTVWNYEAGAKGVWLNGALSADADVYYIKWSNIQLNALIDGLTVTGNGGNAHSEGVEFEGQFRPVSGLVLGANWAYDQTRVDTISATSTAGAEIGDPLPNVPKWSGALTADYSFPIMSATGTIGVTYRYQGSAASSFSGLNTNIDATIPAYSVVDMRARLDWKQYSLIFRVDNLANEYALSNLSLVQLIPGAPAAVDPIDGSGVPIQPRTFRLSLEARF